MGVRVSRESVKAISESVNNFPFPHFPGVLLTASYIIRKTPPPRSTHLRIHQPRDYKTDRKNQPSSVGGPTHLCGEHLVLGSSVSGAIEAGARDGHERRRAREHTMNDGGRQCSSGKLFPERPECAAFSK